LITAIDEFGEIWILAGPTKERKGWKWVSENAPSSEDSHWSPFSTNLMRKLSFSDDSQEIFRATKILQSVNSLPIIVAKGRNPDEIKCFQLQDDGKLVKLMLDQHYKIQNVYEAFGDIYSLASFESEHNSQGRELTIDVIPSRVSPDCIVKHKKLSEHFESSTHSKALKLLSQDKNLCQKIMKSMNQQTALAKGPQDIKSINFSTVVKEVGLKEEDEAFVLPIYDSIIHINNNATSFIKYEKILRSDPYRL